MLLLNKSRLYVMLNIYNQYIYIMKFEYPHPLINQGAGRTKSDS